MARNENEKILAKILEVCNRLYFSNSNSFRKFFQTLSEYGILATKGGAMINRAVIKLSGEQLGLGAEGSFYNDAVIDSIALQIKQARKNGTQLAIVVGGGNLWRGREANPSMNRVKADQIGMLATVMNAIYLEEAFRKQDVAAKVMTPFPIGNFTTSYEKDKALDMMKSGNVIINAAGLGHPLFSTDTVTALRAAELEADIVLFAKPVDGVYTADPQKVPSAKKYKSLSYSHGIKNSLGIADMAALHMLNDAGIPSYFFKLDVPESINLACKYPETKNLEGTYLCVEGQEEFYGH